MWGLNNHDFSVQSLYSSPLPNPEDPTFFAMLPGTHAWCFSRALSSGFRDALKNLTSCPAQQPLVQDNPTSMPFPSASPSSSFVLWWDFWAFLWGQGFPLLSISLWRGVEWPRCSPVRGGSKGCEPQANKKTPTSRAKARGAVPEHVLLDPEVIL